MAKFRIGDRAEFNGVKGVITSVKEGGGGISTGYHFKGDNGVMYEPAEGQLKWVKNSCTSTNPVVQNAIAAKAYNGSYDTLIIRKEPKFGNKWCIYQDGNSNRMVPRVFDSPEWAKKYIKEDLPAWKDAKIRVK